MYLQISENRGNVQSNKQNIGTNGENIEINKNNIIKNNEEIQHLDSKHQELSSKFDKSNLKFHVETKQGDIWWPENTDVTYETKLADTHNALDMASGIFTAPFDGVYGFMFYSWFCTDNGNLYAGHNDVWVHVFNRYNSAPTDTNQASTVYFALNLKQNDKLKINSSTSKMYHGFPATFTGFLLL